MTERSKYRRELKSWSKNDLIREVERLRAITREHADQPSEDTADLPSDMVDVANDPYARGSVVLDARNAILMNSVDVCLVDPDPGELDDPGRLFLSLLLAGRVNMRDERSQVMFIFGVDGAAAIVSQLFGVATRIGPEFADLLAQRVAELP